MADAKDALLEHLQGVSSCCVGCQQIRHRGSNKHQSTRMRKAIEGIRTAAASRQALRSTATGCWCASIDSCIAWEITESAWMQLSVPASRASSHEESQDLSPKSD